MATATENGAKSAAKVEEGGVIQLIPLKLQTVDIEIVGATDLIVHAWSQKAKGEMLAKQMNPGTRSKKEPKDPNADYEASMYRFEDGRHGFPAVAFKGAIVGACRLFDGLTMVEARRIIHVAGEGSQQLVEIEGEPYMREDMVRIGNGVADLRYRAAYPDWKSTISVTFNAGMLALEGLLSLVNAAGIGGVGEWRPEKGGNYGTFTADFS